MIIFLSKNEGIKISWEEIIKKSWFFELEKGQNSQRIEINEKILCGLIRQIVSKLMVLKPDDSYRIKKTKDLLERLYDLGLIKNKTSLKEIDEIGISKFCRRRLSVILFKNKYCESIKQAITYIEQGQIQLGTDVIYDPSLMVTRSMEDHISWVKGSKIQRKIDTYNDKIDDYDVNN